MMRVKEDWSHQSPSSVYDGNKHNIQNKSRTTNTKTKNAMNAISHRWFKASDG